MSFHRLKFSVFLALVLAISAGATVTLPTCGLTLLVNKAMRELASAKNLSLEQHAYINKIIDEVHPPLRKNDITTRNALDAFRDDPKGAEAAASEIQKSMSGYWTLNAMNYLLSDATLPTEQRAQVFQHFADEITRRTQHWQEPWKMVAAKNKRGDYTFLGALHCMVILNEPNGRVYKGSRPYSDANGTIANPGKYFTEWEPRDAINKDIFLASKSDAN